MVPAGLPTATHKQFPGSRDQSARPSLQRSHLSKELFASSDRRRWKGKCLALHSLRKDARAPRQKHDSDCADQPRARGCPANCAAQDASTFFRHLWTCKLRRPRKDQAAPNLHRSEEHTSELQSLAYLVCRLLLEKKKNNK